MVLGELVGVAREVAREKELFLAESLILVGRLLGRGLEELGVSGLDLASELDFLDESVGGVDGERRVGEDEGGLAAVVPGVAHIQGASLPHGAVKRNQVTGCPILANFRILSRFRHFAGPACVVCNERYVQVGTCKTGGIWHTVFTLWRVVKTNRENCVWPRAGRVLAFPTGVTNFLSHATCY